MFLFIATAAAAAALASLYSSLIAEKNICLMTMRENNHIFAYTLVAIARQFVCKRTRVFRPKNKHGARSISVDFYVAKWQINLTIVCILDLFLLAYL